MADWGGDWTVKKKKVLKMYLDAYQKALKNTHFKKWYIDAFAGIGVHLARHGKTAETSSMDFDPIEADEWELEIRSHGSPLLALNTDPPFDMYVFIEKKESNCNVLKRTIESYEKSRVIYILNEDANDELMKICQWMKEPRNIRGVLFLDPFGMEVSWSTLSAVADTGIIDVWYLFPTMAVKRMLPKNGKIIPAWKKCLDNVLGASDWESILYVPNDKENNQMRMFGDSTRGESFRPASEKEIEAYVVQRMNSIFSFVVDEPLSLYNTRSKQLFSLIFAMSNKNPKAINLGKRIAKHIISVNQEVT